ncbi:alpha-1,6-mannosyl-glycoprotein 2-beta-N-acetylglucosaminyltransferase isoform X1 [Ischnura elegans]|uniref:alpha-1,6-mannosyl-glycoprotein 2-beta-N-acetylglucosaminyltransferase isoform X1 n=2 Tax=Ischnura elegans TaxID=197161 RepID=UPI001ED88F6E|nr:alpha-1,6-mannosyl-glycoprotein 2-beta-N-acetylglucosaminyltransferase isoform X1 [Ischnura elegans]
MWYPEARWRSAAERWCSLPRRMLPRRKAASCRRTAVFLVLVTFIWLQLHVPSPGGNGGAASGTSGGASGNGAAGSAGSSGSRASGAAVSTGPFAGGSAAAAGGALDANNAEAAAVLKMVPKALHKFLLLRTGEVSGATGAAAEPSPQGNATAGNGTGEAGERADFPAASTSSAAGGGGLNVSEILRRVEKHNELQLVLNEEAFGPVLNDTLIIVVQVHTRIAYLRHLIVSLAQARGIEKALLVFSHDYYDEGINALVRSVDFCKVMQVFYPASIQTHPDTFPGDDPNDCPRNIKKEQALLKGCNNAPYPDLYGHYREAKFTQTKHHWWWKANRVFDQLEVTRNHSGLVLFLEEDHYVTEDFIHVLRLMERTRKASCEQCNVLSLGTYLKTYNYYGDAKRKEALKAKQRHQQASAGSISPSWSFQILPSLYQHYQKAEVTPWVSSKHNMGMAFDRHTWAEIRRCAEFFCTYDDYNWDWSLQHISQPTPAPPQSQPSTPKQGSAGGGCLGSSHRLIAMVMKGPRVFHIGECGVHHKKNNCEPTAVIQKVQQVVKQASKHFFPSHLTLIFTGGANGGAGGGGSGKNGKQQKPRKGNGGWGDRRDHQLCINMTRVGR